jgi:hypothetical protein
MTQHTAAIAFAAVFLALTSTPVRSADCVDSHVTLTAESGEQYVRSCTQDKPQDVAGSRQQPNTDVTVRDEPPAQVASQPLATTQSAQAR